MRFSLNIEFNFFPELKSSVYYQSRGATKMASYDDDWAEKRAREIQENRKQAQTDKEHFNKQQDFLKAHAPSFWANTRAAVQAEVKKFNNAMDEHALIYEEDGTGMNVVIKASNSDLRANLVLDAGTFEISAFSVTISKSYSAHIESSDGKAQLIYRDNMSSNRQVYQSPEYIAREFVKHAATNIS